MVAASRLEAMALKRREYYFRTDRDGNYQIYEGIRAEARVISVIRAGVFVDLFGAECYIPLRELSYQRWVMLRSTTSLASACWYEYWKWTVATATTPG